MMFIKHYAPNRCFCKINNVQLITGVRIVEISQLQNCSVMCAKKEVIVKIKIKKSQGGGGQERCVQRMEVIVVKRKKKLGGGGLKEDANEEVKLL